MKQSGGDIPTAAKASSGAQYAPTILPSMATYEGEIRHKRPRGPKVEARGSVCLCHPLNPVSLLQRRESTAVFHVCCFLLRSLSPTLAPAHPSVADRTGHRAGTPEPALQQKCCTLGPYCYYYPHTADGKVEVKGEWVALGRAEI